VTADGFDQLITRQTELIGALDAGDPDAILAASAALAKAVEILRADNRRPDRQNLDHGLKLAHAAQIRVNYLTAWNRQNIDRLAQIRGQATNATYNKWRISGA
jgi:hypothetical protein